MPEPRSQNVNLPNAGNWNLPFHPRLVGYESIGTVDSRGQGVGGREVSVKRGYIRTNPRVLDGERKQEPVRYLYFLYNPATVSTNYSVQLEGPAAASSMDAENPIRVLTQLDQTLNFSLLFDRTYEVMGGSPEGAWRDVRAALALVGILKHVDQSAMYTTGSDFDAGPMIYTPAFFHFGNQVGGLTYFGFLTGMSIEYTHFSKDMIPIRVGMHMSAQLLQLPPPDAGGNSESGTSPSDNVEGPIYGPFPPQSGIDELTPFLDQYSVGRNGSTSGNFSINQNSFGQMRLWDN